MMGSQKKKRGFTLIELLVVMAIIATLLTFAAPRYIGNVDKARESVLRENLASIRDVLDKFYGDTGKYPQSLDDLVTHKYLRLFHVAPVTESNKTWVVVAPENPDLGGVFDIHSGSSARAKDGTLYREW